MGFIRRPVRESFPVPAMHLFPLHRRAPPSRFPFWFYPPCVGFYCRPQSEANSERHPKGILQGQAQDNSRHSHRGLS